MHLTRLRLNGFKSFVDPTELVIAEGLTGVVGPNGCGKSNLLEALRWVMGENRASAMRGGGMEDVIFAGAATRPARNFAEVALNIDNSERRAPAAFNDSDLLDVTRRITRDAGSAYKVNSRDVRARDVQLLFADASTGAHSPSLVRQGQISELINAKPKARRRILEEAAGISGLYQRRHEAELKLRSSEANLARLDDVLEQLRGQLSQLSRQAKQAARYRAIGTDLRTAEALLLVLRWQESLAASEAAQAALGEQVRGLGQAESAVAAARSATEAAETATPPAREEATIAAAILQRALVERDGLRTKAEAAETQIADLKGRLAQIDADAAREATLDGDARETLERLASEAGSIRAAQADEEGQQTEADAAAETADAALAEGEQALSEAAQTLARDRALHETVGRAVTEAEAAQSKARAALASAETALSEETAKAETAELAQTDAAAALEVAGADLKRAEVAMEQGESARAGAQEAHGQLKSDRAAAESTLRALSGEIATLARLVEQDRGADGQILDAIAVAPGFEAALGAVLGEDLAEPLRDAPGGSGWHALAPYDAAPSLPGQATPLADHVTGPDALARRLSQVGIVDAEAGAALHSALVPGQRLVSPAGDVWRWDGLVRAAGDAPSAAALRLKQINRLAELRREEDTARAAVAAVAARESRAAEAFKAASDDEAAARLARRAADAALAEAGRRHSRAGLERDQAEGRVARLDAARETHAAELAAATERLEAAVAAKSELPDLSGLSDRVELQRTGVEAARIAVMSRRAARDELRRAAEGRRRRLERIVQDEAQWRGRLDSAAARAADLAERRARCADDLTKAEPLPAEIAAQAEALSAEIARGEARKAAADDAVAAVEATLRDARAAEREADRACADRREARAAAQARLEAAGETLAAAADRLTEALDLSPEDARAQQDPDALTASDPTEVEARVHRLRRQRDALGAVNLRAEEDAQEVEVEIVRLDTDKNDLEAAIAKLRGGISSLNREGRERLLTAFEQVNDNFGTLFTHLFGGGEARLALIESDDPLEAGLEILCQPPGKKLSTLSLLSGGEQTLTALALIFGVFLANPAPICVLDEVDAPLDDANVTRFCELLDDMTRRTQTRFLIITHHAVTMSRMDRLFGVTMGEQGISQLVSVDLKGAESLVA
ncbi:MAG: chromosome segregation protein SMC [Rhodobacteraceae bacterium]|nr:chromosome segregation protein SMC [Paracoccaceae bacterium]